MREKEVLPTIHNVYHPHKHFSNITHEMTVKTRRTFLAQSRKDRFVISGQKWPKEPNADKMKEKIKKKGVNPLITLSRV